MQMRQKHVTACVRVGTVYFILDLLFDNISELVFLNFY
jgi:hypothetical protein